MHVCVVLGEYSEKIFLYACFLLKVFPGHHLLEVLDFFALS